MRKRIIDFYLSIDRNKLSEEHVMTSKLIELINVDERDKVTAALESAWTLPPPAYTDARVFSEEVENIFLKDWMCVARTEQVSEKGDYLSVDLPDLPLVLTRDLDGTLHALSRVCIHRAMPIVEGHGSARRFVCPYHKWTYELDGRLRSAPMMQGAAEFEAKECRLPELQLEEWNGFIFVNASSDPAPLKPQISGLQAIIGNYDFEALRIVDTLHYPSPWNWKILIENFMEAYHHVGTHKDSLEAAYPARASSVPDNLGEPWAFLHMPGVTESASAGSSFPALTNDERSSLFAATIFPSFLIAASNEAGVWYQLKPRAHDEMDLYIHILLHPDLSEGLSDEELAHVRLQFSSIHEEDIEANAGPWLGLNSRLATQGRLSPYEKAIWQLNQYWVQRMDLAP